jgi:hypothetical protein
MAAIAVNDPRWKVAAKSLRFKFPGERGAEEAFYEIDRKMPDRATFLPHADAIEAQDRGRSGRQGSIGRPMSPEDELLKIGRERAERFLRTLGWVETAEGWREPHYRRTQPKVMSLEEAWRSDRQFIPANLT